MLTKDNNPLRKTELRYSSPTAPRRVPHAGATFELDASGIMKVSATYKGIRKGESIIIKNNKGSLSQEETDRMFEAENLIAEDEEQRKSH